MSRAHKARLALFTVATIGIAASCDENLPAGPETFTNVGLAIVVPKDTLVVGDSSKATARATDGQSRLIRGLSFQWVSADTNILGIASIVSSDTESMSGRIQTFVGKRPGRSTVGLALPDARFATNPISRPYTVVVGGVRVLSSRDTTLTAVNDTGRAIASGLVRLNGALVNKASQGTKWTHLGNRTTVIGTGDTIRYVSQTNGADTLIASNDYCLAGAKCADTVIVRVSQQLSLTLGPRSFQSWTFYDSLAPSVTLSDRRGNGQPGTIIRFVPRTALDSTLVTVLPGPFGITNPTTGVMATPRARTSGNGVANVIVQGISPTGLVLAVDSFSVAIRQVARRVAAEPQRAIMSSVDILPIKGVARDARGAPISDATILLTPTGIPYDGVYVGPAQPVNAQATVVPTLSGSSLPGANPGAPQIPVTVGPSVITILEPDSVKAGTTSLNVSTQVLDSLGQFAISQLVLMKSVTGTVVEQAFVDASGTVSALWTPPNTAGTYTLTGVRSTPQLSTVSDSAGRIVIRRSVLVYADVPDAVQSTLSLNATTVAQGGTLTLTVVLKDRFGNPAKGAAPADFTPSAAGVGGTFSGATCNQGTCTVTYTAPNTAGAASISVKIGVANISFSPINITVN